MAKDLKTISEEFRKILEKFKKVVPMLDILTGDEQESIILYGKSGDSEDKYDSISLYNNRVIGFSFERDGKTSGFVSKKEAITSITVKMDDNTVSLTIYNGTIGYNVDVPIEQKDRVKMLIDSIFR